MISDSSELYSGTATLTFAKVPLYKCCSIGFELSCGSNELPIKNGLLLGMVPLTNSFPSSPVTVVTLLSVSVSLFIASIFLYNAL